MDKTYNHKDHEEKIYSFWEKRGYFSPRIQKGKRPFTIIMPPPNANDNLHIGHARFVAIEDILTRYHRMKGEPTLWLPGADHAGIETQYVFEKRLQEKGQSRFDFDRDTLYKMIWNYVQENKKNMENQLRALGASCDWTRNKFTLDPDIIKIVYKTFKKLYADGLVYRGNRLINYCTRCGTGYSELEVDKVEKGTLLYYIKYPKADGHGFVTVATTRPEPIFIDTHLAVNPKDKKRKSLIGSFVINPLTAARMEIIGDEYVDPNFGTGIVKITPAHDFNDFEVAQKHRLPIVQAINKEGKITKAGGKYSGMTVKEAREAVVKDLQEKGLIEKIDGDYKTVMGVCYRCKNQIEPMLSEQWFVKVAPLVAVTRNAVKTGKVKFPVKRFEKMLLHWLDILFDWNISRQIVWGMRIPAWLCKKCGEWTITDGAPPSKCKCGNTKLEQDIDTFDTWFSSGQWPFATLKTCQPGDFGYFYPTSVMNTAYDILPRWVLRMMMLGIYETGDVPFKDVLIHGLVRDKEGQKISKSKGNVINPLEMSEKYGADALRMGLTWGALVESDISLSEDNIRGQRNFSNKIWNVARFVLADMDKWISRQVESGKKKSTHLLIYSSTHPDDIWILGELKKTTKKVTQSLDKYRLNEAATEIYDFIWHKFADIYIEKVKAKREEAQPTLFYVLQESLKLLHPFMPFVTEVLWQNAKRKMQNKEFFAEEALIIAEWPK